MFKCKSFLSLSAFFLFILLLSGCISAAQHQKELGSTNEREMTVGIVQKEIRTGMSQADVAEALGSPNIVTRDSEGKETWIYDKIATEASYSNSSAGVGAQGLGAAVPGSSLLLGMISGGYSKEAGATSSTQKTLTVLIKYGKNNLVESFSYHTSKF
jgi:outer membrane protein assembly factor BamE (lipoprotein component of BamABCDE complex)